MLSFLAVPALAQTPETALDAALPKLEPVCYARFYDAAHLRAHPQQKVSSVRLVRGFPTIRSERSLEAQREAEQGRSAYFRLIVTYRIAARAASSARALAAWRREPSSAHPIAATVAASGCASRIAIHC